MSTPYLHGGPNGQQDWRAQGIQPYPAFLATAKAASTAGLQLFIHANGDAAMDDVINAVDTLHLPADHRTIVIHSQVQRPDQLPRYAAMGITPSYFTNHTYFWGDVHRSNFGEERAAHISPIKSAMAWAYREEGRRGSIEVGKLADFTLLSANPLATPTARIRAIKVVGTMKEGRVVWETVK